MIGKIEDTIGARGELSSYCQWNGKNEWSIVIKLSPENGELVYFSCNCPYGSFYGQSHKKKEICRHVLYAYAKKIGVTPYKARTILIKQEIMDPKHLIKI